MVEEVTTEMEDSFQKVIEVVQKCQEWEAVVRRGGKTASQAIWIRLHSVDERTHYASITKYSQENPADWNIIITLPTALIFVPAPITTRVLREGLYNADSSRPARETERSSKLSCCSATPPQLVGITCWFTPQSHFFSYLCAVCYFLA